MYAERQKQLIVRYAGIEIGEHRLDLLVEDTVVIALKSVERFDPVFQAQLLSYLKLGGYPVGLHP
ncbi:MAG: GxxExxY protein [Thiotrichales bacterium]|nr:MAG: GxxExxY protein [Thiotrichales bacterium]